MSRPSAGAANADLTGVVGKAASASANFFGAGRGVASAHILREVEVLTLWLRHAVYLFVAFVYLVTPGRAGVGVIVTIFFGVWSMLRMATRRWGVVWTVADLGVVMGYLSFTPELLGGIPVDSGGSGPATVAGSTVIALTLVLPIRLSFPAAALTIAAFAYGCSQVADVASPLTNVAVVFPVIEWVLSAIVRNVVLQSARATDAATAAVTDAQVSSAVSTARRRYEREQWALMHDTAASTLLMVGQDAAPNPDRLAGQARRDLQALRDAIPAGDDDEAVDLVTALWVVCRDCVTPLHLHAPTTLHVGASIGRAIVGATREALTNVDRHARARSVVVTVGEFRVDIVDDGIGFPAERLVDSTRHGVRNSIVRRLREAGATATVTSTPGIGTAVHLRWERQRPSGRPPPPAIEVARLLRGYGYGLAAVAIILILLGAIPVLGVAPVGPQVALVTLAVASAVAAATSDYRAIGPIVRRILTLCASTIGPLHAFLLPAAELVGPAQWSLSASGWVLAAILYRSRLRIALPTLYVAWLVTAVITQLRSPNEHAWIMLANNTAGITVVQTAAILFGALIHRAVRTAEKLTEQQLGVSTHQAIEEALQADYRRRYHELAQTVIPLLNGLATRTMSASDPIVKARASVESTRLRRLFTQSDSFDHPLLQELRPAIDRAERNGATVNFDIAAELPDLPARIRTELLVAPTTLLSAASTRARIVVSTTENTVVISVVCDCTPAARDSVERLTETSPYELTMLEDLTWLQVRHYLTAPSIGLT